MSVTLLAGLLLAATPTSALPLHTPAASEPIIGGDLVAEGDWTSVVAIMHVTALHPNSSLATVDLCSGVMLDKRTVLTAGHCVLDIADVENMAVVFGNRLDTADQRVVATVDQVFVHPNYCTDDDCGADAFDFGLVTIVEDIGGVDFIKPLIDQEEWDATMEPGESVTTVGFGAVREAQEEDPPLEADEIGFKREVSVQIQRLSPTGYEFIAGNEGKDVCGGDSGGPAFVRLDDGSWRIAGIVSRGVVPCGVGESYYGTVYAALPWIRDTVGLDLLPSGCSGLEDDGDTCLDPRPPRSGAGRRVAEPEDSTPALWLTLLAVAAVTGRRRRRP